MLKANKNIKGILLFPLASIIAEEMNGPMKADALPTIENSEKKRNSFPRGQTSEIILPSDGYREEDAFGCRRRTGQRPDQKRRRGPKLLLVCKFQAESCIPKYCDTQFYVSRYRRAPRPRRYKSKSHKRAALP